MSMNRFVGLGIFALSSSVLLTMAACDDSATAPGLTPSSGGTPSATTATSKNNDTDEDTSTDEDTDTATTKATTKTSTTKTGTTSTKAGTGGTSGKATTSKTTVAEGGAENTDTSAAEGGSTGGGDVATEVECILGETDIMPIAAATDTGNWIGGIDDQTADDPCGIQGAFYAYSDTGADGENGGSDDSLQDPPFLSGTEYDNPCKDGKCCIKGKTVLWPKAESGGTVNYDLNWGAGLGFTLRDGGESNPGKSAYSGSAKGFRITLEGDLAGGQTIRIGYTQSETDESAPFSPYTSLGEKDVLFEDVSCPSWATDCTETGYGGPNPYDLQIQVAGGDDEGDFEVCVTNLVPIE